jgi:thymidylate synthase
MNWEEAYEEIKRDLAEMGILVKPKTMQDKNIEGNSDYETKELQNYCYTLLNAKSSDIIGVTQPWADAEFRERVAYPSIATVENGVEKPITINPGKAWELRKDIWTEYMHEGKMAYTYNERIWQNYQLTKIIERLKEDHDSRQLWLSIWDPNVDTDKLGGISRVPCSLGYNFQFRDGKLNIHYVMRSCDFNTHFTNDVYLAIKLLEYVAHETGLEVGSFTHTMFSLHVYKKDLKNVF